MKKLLGILSTAFFLLSFSSSISAQTSTDLAMQSLKAFFAFDRGRYDIALDYYGSEAKKNEPRAQFVLGTIYEKGYKDKIQVDLDRALQHYQKSATGGDSDAQYRLAQLYETGHIVSKDVKKAMGLYTSAAELDNPKAQAKLGNAYYKGLGVEPNKELAFRWLTLTAKHEESTSSIYESSKSTMAMLHDMESQGIRPESDEILFAFYSLNSNKNDLAIQFNLAQMFLEGRGTAKIAHKGVQILRALEEKPHPEAAYQLGVIYSEGALVEEDDIRAMSLFNKALKDGDRTAIYANAYADLLYEYKQYPAALKWYYVAASKGHNSSQIKAVESKVSVQEKKEQRYLADRWLKDRFSPVIGKKYTY